MKGTSVVLVNPVRSGGGRMARGMIQGAVIRSLGVVNLLSEGRVYNGMIQNGWRANIYHASNYYRG
jgi:hypothetical protein